MGKIFCMRPERNRIALLRKQIRERVREKEKPTTIINDLPHVIEPPHHKDMHMYHLRREIAALDRAKEIAKLRQDRFHTQLKRLMGLVDGTSSLCREMYRTHAKDGRLKVRVNKRTELRILVWTYSDYIQFVGPSLSALTQFMRDHRNEVTHEDSIIALKMVLDTIHYLKMLINEATTQVNLGEPEYDDRGSSPIKLGDSVLKFLDWHTKTLKHRAEEERENQ